MEPKDPNTEEKTPSSPETGPSEVQDTDLENTAGGRAQPAYYVIVDDK